MIISHTHPRYSRMVSPYNGAYYYSKEIVENIIPFVHTDRNWITINVKGYACDHSIVFIHNNLHPENYDWLKNYNDLILVCGIPDTIEKVSHLGTAIYVPLSVDVDYVLRFARPKCRRTAFVGRSGKKFDFSFPSNIDYIENLPRAVLLSEMAEYEEVYAVGRTAIEAKILGCKVLPYDERFPDPSIWKIRDNTDAVHDLNKLLKEIDDGK